MSNEVLTIFLGIGSNIEPKKNLVLAIQELEKRFGKLEKSSVYRSKAYGFEGDEFLNMVVALDSDLAPIEVHAQLEEIQGLAMRERGSRGHSSRTLDIDLLLYADLVLNEPPIRLPRPDVLRFGFVLGPLVEIAPELQHPETRQSYQDHWDNFDIRSHPINRESLIL